METSILKSIYKNDFQQFSHKPISTPEFKALNHKIDMEYAYFASKLSPDDCKRFISYHNLLLERFCTESFEEQYDGFTLGILIGIELSEKKMEILA